VFHGFRAVGVLAWHLLLAAGLFAHALADFCGYRARSATWLGDRGSEGRFCSVEVS
jgi:hypothetical protein